MKRRLSNIMFGMLALLFVLASPVFAEKDPFKQMGKGVPMTNMKIQKLDGKNLSMPGKQFKSGTLFSTPPTDIGVFNQKSYIFWWLLR